MKHKLLTALLTGVIINTSFTVSAQNSGAEMPYGPRLMTQQEWQQHREMMRSFQTNEERLAYRRQIHEEMRLRAQQRGISMPEQPPMWGGQGMGMGSNGQGNGWGKGSGKGSGKGQGN